MSDAMEEATRMLGREIRKRIDAAVAVEREACAKVCDDAAANADGFVLQVQCVRLAQRIRARATPVDKRGTET